MMPPLSPVFAVFIINCLSIAALLSGAIGLWRTGRSRTARVIAGVLLGVTFEAVAASVAIFYEPNTWAWATVKILGRLLELGLAVRFLFYLSAKAKNGGVKVE